MPIGTVAAAIVGGILGVIVLLDLRKLVWDINRCRKTIKYSFRKKRPPVAPVAVDQGPQAQDVGSPKGLWSDQAGIKGWVSGE